MSLTKDDLVQIRDVVQETVALELRPVRKSLERLEGRVEAMENDIKDIYAMITDLQKHGLGDKGFRKLSLQDRLLILNDELLVAAKEAGITLPRE